MSEKSNEETATTSTPNEEPYAKIKSKVEILDVLFNPNADKTLINLGLINGKLKMYSSRYHAFLILSHFIFEAMT